MITYRDSCGDVTITITETKWAKEVTLPPAFLASLLVTIVNDSNRKYYNPIDTYDPPDRRYKLPLLSGKIITATDTVADYGDYVIIVATVLPTVLEITWP